MNNLNEMAIKIAYGIGKSWGNGEFDKMARKFANFSPRLNWKLCHQTEAHTRPKFGRFQTSGGSGGKYSAGKQILWVIFGIFNWKMMRKLYSQLCKKKIFKNLRKFKSLLLSERLEHQILFDNLPLLQATAILK